MPGRRGFRFRLSSCIFRILRSFGSVEVTAWPCRAFQEFLAAYSGVSGDGETVSGKSGTFSLLYRYSCTVGIIM